MSERRERALGSLRSTALQGLMRALQAATRVDAESVKACMAAVSSRLYTVKFTDRLL